MDGEIRAGKRELTILRIQEGLGVVREDMVFCAIGMRIEEPLTP